MRIFIFNEGFRLGFFTRNTFPQSARSHPKQGCLGYIRFVVRDLVVLPLKMVIYWQVEQEQDIKTLSNLTAVDYTNIRAGDFPNLYPTRTHS